MYSIEQQQFGLKKEVSRGTAETAPTKWYPVEKDSHLEYKLALIQDQALRGIPEPFAPVSGIKTGSGKIKFPMDPQVMGEFFNSLLGTVVSTQQGVTVAYKHTFTRATTLQRPGYTFFLDRGISVQKYNLGTVKKMTINGPVDNLIMVDTDVLFKSEASGGIGTPAFPTQRYQAFNNVVVNLNGAQNTDIKNWQLHIDNQAYGHRTQSGSQDVADIIIRNKLDVGGTFTIYFQDEVERAKFLANTAASMEFIMTGATIASTYHYALDINCYEIHYEAFPYQEADGLLAANVSWKAVYNASATKMIQVDLTNTDTSY